MSALSPPPAEIVAAQQAASDDQMSRNLCLPFADSLVGGVVALLVGAMFIAGGIASGRNEFREASPAVWFGCVVVLGGTIALAVGLHRLLRGLEHSQARARQAEPPVATRPDEGVAPQAE